MKSSAEEDVKNIREHRWDTIIIMKTKHLLDTIIIMKNKHLWDTIPLCSQFSSAVLSPSSAGRSKGKPVA